MKLWVEPDEYWPWFNISHEPDRFRDGIDVDLETAERWRVALAAAVLVQEEIRRLVGWDR